MKFKLSIVLVATSLLFVITACKESNLSSGDDGGSSALTEPLTAGYVLFDSDSIKMLPAGTVLIDTEEMKMEDCKMIFEMQGEVMEGVASRFKNQKRITTYNSAGKVTVEIKKSTSRGSAVLNGEAKTQPINYEPLHGKTVILTKTNGRWSGQLGSGEANEKQQEAIDRMAKGGNGEGDSSHIYGNTPRKVGASWDVDTSKLTFMGGNEGDTKGTFKMTFESIEKYQGQDCAVLVADVDVHTRDDGMVMEMKGKFKIYRSLDYFMDLDNQMEVHAIMSITFNDGSTKMKVDGPMTQYQKTELKLP